MPRLRSESFGSGDQRWIGSPHGIYDTLTVTLDPTLFTAGTHFPTGTMKSGIQVNIANEKAVRPFTGAAGEKLAFLYTDQNVVGTKKFAAPVLAHGTIKTGRLPITFIAPTDPTQFVFRGGVL